MNSQNESEAPSSAAPPADATPAPPISGARLGLPAKLGLAALAVCALSALFWPKGRSAVQEPGGFLYDSTGRAATIGSRLSPVTLVHFWATWCPPCIQETPKLQRLIHDFSGNQDFSVVMVAVADSSDRVRTFLGPGSEMVLFDPNWKVANRYGTDKLPETYLVVRGQVVRKWVGMTDWDDQALRADLAARLKDGASKTAALRP
ncbi:MAG TPA: TlpA disulfide reductase family protein [Thermoanaerobaculia bacterium]|jgi:thiol-disulfide isomerase/thioredoxin